MKESKRQLWLEVVVETLQRIHGELCRERKIEQAEQLYDIIRRLILLSKDV